MAHTIRFTRRKLPHWEVENGRYFVTVRCADSLPRDAVLRMAEMHETLSTIEPHSAAFVALQRETFRTLEKYLDAGHGACRLGDSAAAALLAHEFEQLADWHVAVPHYTIMPNHWHALIVPADECTHSLSQVIHRIKGRTARSINRLLQTNGKPLWQREWFDRWIRNDAEWERTVAYLRNNPVKAGLVNQWSKHKWTR